MKLIGMDILNSNDYNEILIKDDAVIVSGGLRYPSIPIGNKISDCIFRLCDRDKVRGIINYYLDYNLLSGIEKMTIDGEDYVCINGCNGTRKLLFPESYASDILLKIRRKYQQDRLKFLYNMRSTIYYLGVGNQKSNYRNYDDVLEFSLSEDRELENGFLDYLMDYVFENQEAIIMPQDSDESFESIQSKRGGNEFFSNTSPLEFAIISEDRKIVVQQNLLSDVCKALGKHNAKIRLQNENNKVIQMKMEGF